jgi:hypothetical protein
MQLPKPEMPAIPGEEPAEGRTEMELPGADRDDPSIERPYTPNPRGDRPTDPEPPDDPNADLPERLGRRITEGSNSGIASGEPDLVPDVEVPDATM